MQHVNKFIAIKSCFGGGGYASFKVCRPQFKHSLFETAEECNRVGRAMEIACVDPNHTKYR